MDDRLHHLVLSLSGFYGSVVLRNGNTTAYIVARWNSGSIGETIYMYLFLTLISLDLI